MRQNYFLFLQILSGLLLIYGAATAQESGATVGSAAAVPAAAVPNSTIMIGELVLALLLCLVVSWLLFSLFWHSLDNPSLGVRISYLFTGTAVAAYLLWSWYPRYLELRYGNPGNLRWIVFGVVLLLLVILDVVTYQRMPSAEGEDLMEEQELAS